MVGVADGVGEGLIVGVADGAADGVIVGAADAGVLIGTTGVPELLQPTATVRTRKTRQTRFPATRARVMENLGCTKKVEESNACLRASPSATRQ